ncbi:MAG TPA: hypothetical protein V6C84_06450 [Coleofasciculaceae cyanobacterium]
MFNRSTSFRFWSQWVLINVLCLVTSFALAGVVKELDTESHRYFAIDSPNTIDCVMSGLVLGLAQWLCLKKIIPNLRRKWILASLIALPVSVFTTFVIEEFHTWMNFNHWCSMRCSIETLIRHGFTGGIVGGAISGLIQLSTLKQQVQPISLMILLLANIVGSALGWAAGWGAASYAGYSLFNGYNAIYFNDAEREIIQLSVLGLVFGLVNGAIVGGGLLWTLQRSRLVV